MLLTIFTMVDTLARHWGAQKDREGEPGESQWRAPGERAVTLAALLPQTLGATISGLCPAIRLFWCPLDCLLTRQIVIIRSDHYGRTQNMPIRRRAISVCAPKAD